MYNRTLNTDLTMNTHANKLAEYYNIYLHVLEYSLFQQMHIFCLIITTAALLAYVLMTK